MRKLTSSTQPAAFLFVDSWWHEPHDAAQRHTHGLTFEFLFEFQTEFFVQVSNCSRIKLFDFWGSTACFYGTKFLHQSRTLVPSYQTTWCHNLSPSSIWGTLKVKSIHYSERRVDTCLLDKKLSQPRSQQFDFLCVFEKLNSEKVKNPWKGSVKTFRPSSHIRWLNAEWTSILIIRELNVCLKNTENNTVLGRNDI